MHALRSRPNRFIAALAVAVVASAALPGGLGAPVTAGATVPTPAEVVVGENYSCARMSDATVRCWGSNRYGQLGDGTFINRLTPVTVTGLTGVTALSVGGETSCAIAGGQLYCWGANTYSQLGDGTVTHRATPRRVTPAGMQVRQVRVLGSHACAVTTSNRLYCWGDNTRGQLGVGDGSPRRVPTLALAPKVDEIRSIGGQPHRNTCAVLKPGMRLGVPSLWCAGGDGRTPATWLLPDDRTRFVHTESLDSAEYLLPTAASLYPSASLTHHCRVLRVNGARLQCGGNNFYGQLGNGNRSSVTAWEPLATVPGNYFVATLGRTSTCAYEVDHREYRCWGRNDHASASMGGVSPLGLGYVGGSLPVPTPVEGFAPPASAYSASISTNGAHTCATGRDGAGVSSVYCWGHNSSGQLGDGSQWTTTRPVKVQSLG
jgi:alpha-tubulin suppressor-like RCC1 family protein